jgi:hypothetical protein
VIIHQHFHKFADLRRNSERATTALENCSRSLASAENCYPVDERQVIGSADSLGCATAVFANFELDNLLPKIPCHDGIPGLMKGGTANRITRVSHLGRSWVVPPVISFG